MAQIVEIVANIKFDVLVFAEKIHVFIMKLESGQWADFGGSQHSFCESFWHRTVGAKSSVKFPANSIEFP